MEQSIKISRQELYDQVWSKPLTHLAKEYNLSDVGLAKICRRHDIPLPPVGYWAKLAQGHIVKKTPLPPFAQVKLDTIEIPSKMAPAFDEVRRKEDFEDVIANAIGHSFVAVDEFKTVFHPLIIESQKEYPERLKIYKNAGESERIHVHNISVTKSSFDRAFLLMNKLFQVVEANGLLIGRQPGYGGGTYVKTTGIDIQIDLKEKTKRAENPDPKSFNKYEFHPTGTLFFEIEYFYADGARKTWSDTQSRQPEETINEVGIGIVVAAILKKRQNQERQAVQQKEEFERVKRRLKEEEQEKEGEKVNSLLEDAHKWHTSNVLRAYIKAVEETHSSKNTLTCPPKHDPDIS